MLQCIQGKVIKKTDSGVDIKVHKSGVSAFIPTIQLSDHRGYCELLLKAYSEGDTLKEVVYTAVKSNTVVSFSKKILFCLLNIPGTFFDFDNIL